MGKDENHVLDCECATVDDFRNTIDYRTELPISEDVVHKLVDVANEHRKAAGIDPIVYHERREVSGGTPCPACGSSEYYRIGTCMQCRNCLHHTGCG